MRINCDCPNLISMPDYPVAEVRLHNTVIPQQATFLARVSNKDLREKSYILIAEQLWCNILDNGLTDTLVSLNTKVE